MGLYNLDECISILIVFDIEKVIDNLDLVFKNGEWLLKGIILYCL